MNFATNAMYFFIISPFHSQQVIYVILFLTQQGDMNFASYDQSVMCQSMNPEFGYNNMYLNGKFIFNDVYIVVY